MVVTCKYCGRSLSNRGMLRRHQMTAALCLEAQGDADRKSNTAQHEPPPPCGGCDKRFNRRDLLLRHLSSCPLLLQKTELEALHEAELTGRKALHQAALASEYKRGRADATREIVDSLTGLDKAVSRVRTLEKRYLRKQPRKKYEKNVVYVLTTPDLLARGTYIVGSATCLENRLSTYNKTCEHSVVRYSKCGDASSMKLMERMVLARLDGYRELPNRDRFVVPKLEILEIFDEAERFLTATPPADSLRQSRVPPDSDRT